MEKINQLKELLREDRIKHGVDYVILHKYNKTHVLTSKVWQQSIQEAADKLELTIDSWHIAND